MSLYTHFVPYTKHQDIEKPDVLEREFAKTGRMQDCMETLLANRRWDQYLEAHSLSGRLVKIYDGGLEKIIRVVRVERSMSAVTECFVLVSIGGWRFPVTPDTRLLVETSRG